MKSGRANPSQPFGSTLFDKNSLDRTFCIWFSMNPYIFEQKVFVCALPFRSYQEECLFIIKSALYFIYMMRII